MSHFDYAAALALVTGAEGGFVDDPKDRGGATNLGISLAFARALGDADGDGRADLDLDGDGDVDEVDIKLITVERAAELYREHFWNRVKADGLPPPLALLAFDCAVNQGVRVAARILQLAVGATADGVVGPRTLARASVAPLPGAIDELVARRGVHYSYCASRDAHILGWMRRLASMHRLALAWAGSDGDGA